MDTWIKLYRKFTEWQWYGDINCKVVFLHLLLTANWEPKKWQGIVIDAGELVTSIASLADEINLTENQVRLALKKLIESDVISKKSFSKFTVIRIENYTAYQTNHKQQHNQTTSNSTKKPQANHKVQSKVCQGVEGLGENQNHKQTTSNSTRKPQATAQENHKQTTTPKELKNKRNIEYRNIDAVVGIYNINNNIGGEDKAAAEAKKMPEVSSLGSESEVSSSEEFGQVFKDYEQNIGVLSPMIAEILKDRITAQGAALVSLAIAEAVCHNVKNIRYIERVLDAWESNNITTVDAAKLRIAERSAKVKENSALAGNVAKSRFRNYPEDNGVGEAEMKAIEKLMRVES